jgi:hypothetical protein
VLRWLRLFALVVFPVLALAIPAGTASALPGTPVFPGMEIHQDTNSCTVGFVDPATRVAYTAGHCRGSGLVNDRNGNFVGTQAGWHDNTPDGATITTDHMISDWETIALGNDVAVNNILPNGHALVEDPAIVPVAGMPVCHFGVVTGESCGTIDSVNNGWFTMANGVVSRKGDSGGPVYTLTPDGRAVIVGIFNSTWGQFPAAVSWQAAKSQAGAPAATVVAAANVIPTP